MIREDFEDRYKKWWVGKKCRPRGYPGEFERVKDVNFTGPPSGIYGTVELIFENGTSSFVGVNQPYKATKKDVEVLEED